MNMQPAHQINFKAKYVSSTYVSKFDNSCRKYMPEKVALVKISPNNKDDIKALAAIKDLWQSQFAVPDILKTISKIRLGGFEDFKYEVYALTAQKNKFKTLDANKILCVADICPCKEDKSAYICDLEVKRNYRFDNKRGLFKKIGSGFLNAFKKMFNIIELQSVYSATNFYEKNGFNIVEPKRLLYRWEK